VPRSKLLTKSKRVVSDALICNGQNRGRERMRKHHGSVVCHAKAVHAGRAGSSGSGTMIRGATK